MMRKGIKRRYVTRRKTKRGGSATSLPGPYFNTAFKYPDASSGKDLLNSIGNVIRPKIGGTLKKIFRKKGGFVPSIMEGFTQMAGKYILPLATISGYRLLNRTQKKGRSKRRRHTRKRV